MLCYVGLHGPAHDWASRRKIETNPVTGGAQIVVILQTVREIQTPYQFSWSRSKSFRYPQYHYLPQTHRDFKSEQRPGNHCRHPRFFLRIRLSA